jgi:outer membrane immunogenic protein
MKKFSRAGSVIGAVTYAMVGCAMVGCAIVSGAAISGSALAADVPVLRESTVIPVPVYTWNGFYVGFHGGMGFGDVNFIKTPFDLTNHTIDGALLGGHIGYNWQMSPAWLVGVEASGTWSGLKKTVFGVFIFEDDRWTTEVKWLATLTPRVGVTISNWMWYLKGGVVFAEIDHNLASPIGPVSFDVSSTRVGWTIGFGGEVLLHGSWILGLEGNFYHFGSFTANSGIVNFPDHDVDATMWSVLGRVSYKFGGPSYGPGNPVTARY